MCQWWEGQEYTCLLAAARSHSRPQVHHAVLQVFATTGAPTHLWQHGTHQVQSRWPAPGGHDPAAQTHCAPSCSPRCALHTRHTGKGRNQAHHRIRRAECMLGWCLAASTILPPPPSQWWLWFILTATFSAVQPPTLTQLEADIHVVCRQFHVRAGISDYAPDTNAALLPQPSPPCRKACPLHSVGYAHM